MKSNPKYRFTKEARADIRDIRRYTAQHWGVRQRDVYFDQLMNGIERIARYPELGRERTDLSVGCRAARIEQHIVYYRVTEIELIISRVLHHSQDATSAAIP